jgi:hypothetical protein
VERKAPLNFCKLQRNDKCSTSIMFLHIHTFRNRKFWYTLYKCTSCNYLESPLITVKSLVTARHHTMVSLFLSSRPAVIRCIACPESTFQIRTASADPVTIISPVASHARHRIRPIKLATQFQHFQTTKPEAHVLRNNTAANIHHYPYKINFTIYEVHESKYM